MFIVCRNVFLIFKKDNNIKLQKNRFKFKPNLKLKLRFGDCGVLVVDEGRLEFVQLNFVKKLVKFVMRSSKHLFGVYKKVWYNVVANHIIQCKSKNSRMGKGKGLFERRIVRIRKNTILFEFVGVSFFKLNFFIKKINKKIRSENSPNYW